MTVCEEMQKLRDWLDESGIEWQDKSDDISVKNDFWMVRTHFDYKGHHILVINGFGSYGGFNRVYPENLGALDMMICDTEEIHGILSADNVKEILSKLKEFKL